MVSSLTTGGNKAIKIEATRKDIVNTAAAVVPAAAAGLADEDAVVRRLCGDALFHDITGRVMRRIREAMKSDPQEINTAI